MTTICLNISSRESEFEAALAKLKGNAEAKYEYAYRIIKGRWPEAEPSIARNPKIAVEYAINIIKDRWPEAESAIIDYVLDEVDWCDTKRAYVPKQSKPILAKYIRYLIKEKWPEVEPSISADAYCSYYYARNVIKGRWPEGEPAIGNELRLSCWYAKDIVQGRFPDLYVELNILNSDLGHEYAVEAAITTKTKLKNIVYRDIARQEAELTKDDYKNLVSTEDE